MTLLKDCPIPNTFGMKVKAACVVEYDSAAELAALDWDSLPAPVRSIGEGSNLLFRSDFPGTLLRSRITTLKYVDMGLEEIPVIVGSGVKWDDFVKNTTDNGLWGAENLSLIPGTVGAAAVQNIGAYGVEVKDLIKGVTAYDLRERRMVKFQNAECRYAYRDSVFKNEPGRYVITSVLLRVSRTAGPNLGYKGLSEAVSPDANPAQVREAVIGIRRAKLPDPAETGSAGSFFKNPVIGREQYSALLSKIRAAGIEGEPPHFDLGRDAVKVPAAWLIEKAGLKGATEGGAAVYQKQPLVIVNASGEASPADVEALEQHIVETIFSKFGVRLSPEVEHI